MPGAPSSRCDSPRSVRSRYSRSPMLSFAKTRTLLARLDDRAQHVREIVARRVSEGVGVVVADAEQPPVHDGDHTSRPDAFNLYALALLDRHASLRSLV